MRDLLALVTAVGDRKPSRGRPCYRKLGRDPAMAEELSSVSQWLEAMKDGCDEAKTKLWQRYYAQLVELARRRLRGASRRVTDEEDVALDAFERFFRRAEAGSFPKLDDR